MLNEIVLTDSLCLHSTMMGDSWHNDSTGVTKSSAVLQKEQLMIRGGMTNKSTKIVWLQFAKRT